MNQHEMKVFTILNEKGGVGKTTVFLLTVAGLVQRGYRVLGIDGDPQGHATEGVRMPKNPALYNLMVRSDQDAEGNPLTDENRAQERQRLYSRAVRPVAAEWYGGEGKSQLYMIGSNVETRNISNSISDTYKLAEILEPLRPLFDVCVIDTSPTPSLLHGSIFMVTDFVICPTVCEHWSIDGLAESGTHLSHAQKMRDIKLAGVIPTHVRLKTIEHQKKLERLREVYGDKVWEPIPEAIIWAEATGFRMPIQVYAYDHEAARHANSVVDHIEAFL